MSTIQTIDAVLPFSSGSSAPSSALPRTPVCLHATSNKAFPYGSNSGASSVDSSPWSARLCVDVSETRQLRCSVIYVHEFQRVCVLFNSEFPFSQRQRFLALGGECGCSRGLGFLCGEYDFGLDGR